MEGGIVVEGKEGASSEFGDVTILTLLLLLSTVESSE